MKIIILCIFLIVAIYETLLLAKYLMRTKTLRLISDFMTLWEIAEEGHYTDTQLFKILKEVKEKVETESKFFYERTNIIEFFQVSRTMNKIVVELINFILAVFFLPKKTYESVIENLDCAINIHNLGYIFKALALQNVKRFEKLSTESQTPTS